VTGHFIAVEGADGTGKSTQARLLAERLGALFTREPGGTPLGERIRALVLDPSGDPPVDRAEALLMAAARAQHVAEVVEPALAAGRDVVSDRYVASSVAYQGYGRGLGAEAVMAVNRFATDDLQPDLVVLILVDAPVAVRRLGDHLDRIEQAGDAFQTAVVAAYSEMAIADPDRWLVVDGNGTVEEVAARVAAAVEERLR
jgi:dTMP kinase|tara:strand:- start:4142 stop:4741 length:600 start_codon:yes stop_codon:yes gene_type:complete